MVLAVLAGLLTLIVVVGVALFFIVKFRIDPDELLSGDKQSADSQSDPLVLAAQENPLVEEPESMYGSAQRGRLVAMGVLAAAVFGSLTAKLWTMQVLQSGDYSQQSDENLYTTVFTPAPRGIIYDADGIALVKNRSVYTVLASSDVADDRDVLLRLSALLGIPIEVVRQRVLDASTGAQNNRVVAEDVSLRNLAYINEHSQAFPGVTCETRTTRVYPYGALAAHALGYVGTASEEELEEQREGRILQSGDVVGKSGIEQAYDALLAGDHGERVLMTDADGNVKRIVSNTEPTQGSNVYLTIKASVQQVADRVLHDTIAPDGSLGSGMGTGGAIVCMDCTNGDVVAMSSFPTYSPESFIGGIPQDVWDTFNTEESRYPLMNRAIAGTYPAASTFKAFVSAAALSYGIADSDSSYLCTGTWTGFGEDFPQNCWLLTGHGPMGIVSGIANSCDVVFYEIGKAFFEQADDLGEECLQDYIETFSFGSSTGIDISGEAVGRVPTPEWKREYFKDIPTEASWMGGDMSNMSIGQGYVLVTPIQLCCGYCGIATGTIYKPHLLKEVRNSTGETVHSFEPEILSSPELSKENMDLVREGLEQVITLNSYHTQFFSDIGCTVAGKTGTAEVAGQADYTWFACYAPADDPKYVAVCVTEQGSVTTSTSVPMLAQVLQAAIDYDQGNRSDDIAFVDSTYSTVEYNVSSGARQD